MIAGSAVASATHSSSASETTAKPIYGTDIGTDNRIPPTKDSPEPKAHA
jgi:hypothetical protein